MTPCRHCVCNSALNAVGEHRTYDIDLTAVYRCASNQRWFDTPMPNRVVPINKIYWANELTGHRVALWTSVHGMQMLSPASDPLPPYYIAAPDQTAIDPSSEPVNAHPGMTVDDVRAALIASCEQNDVCREYSKDWLHTEYRPVSVWNPSNSKGLPGRLSFDPRPDAIQSSSEDTSGCSMSSRGGPTKLAALALAIACSLRRRRSPKKYGAIGIRS